MGQIVVSFNVSQRKFIYNVGVWCQEKKKQSRLNLKFWLEHVDE